MARTRDFDDKIREVQDGLRKAGVETRRSMADPEVRGLQVRVSARSAVWVYRYRSGGKQRRLKLGTWMKDGGMNTAKARRAAGDERLQVERGVDPVIEKRKAKEAAAKAQRDSMQVLVKDYLDHHAKPNKKSWRQDNLILHNEVLPHWEKRPVSSIERKDVKQLVRAIADRPAPTYAARVRACIHGLFEWAIEEDYTTANPAHQQRTRRGAAKAKVKEEEPYTDSDLLKFWRNTATMAAPLRAAYRLALLTACRFGEVRNAQWADIDGDWWTLTAEQTKNKRAHRVFLTETALAELALITRVEGDTFVFERWRAARTWTDGNKTAYKGLGRREKPNHALRRNVATALGEMGYGLEVRKAVLNHVPPGGVTNAYDRYDRDREKVQALTAWEHRLLVIVGARKADDKVVPFAKA